MYRALTILVCVAFACACSSSNGLLGIATSAQQNKKNADDRDDLEGAKAENTGELPEDGAADDASLPDIATDVTASYLTYPGDLAPLGPSFSVTDLREPIVVDLNPDQSAEIIDAGVYAVIYFKRDPGTQQFVETAILTSDQVTIARTRATQLTLTYDPEFYGLMQFAAVSEPIVTEINSAGIPPEYAAIAQTIEQTQSLVTGDPGLPQAVTEVESFATGPENLFYGGQVFTAQLLRGIDVHSSDQLSDYGTPPGGAVTLTRADDNVPQRASSAEGTVPTRFDGNDFVVHNIHMPSAGFRGQLHFEIEGGILADGSIGQQWQTLMTFSHGGGSRFVNGRCAIFLHRTPAQDYIGVAVVEHAGLPYNLNDIEIRSTDVTLFEKPASIDNQDVITFAWDPANGIELWANQETEALRPAANLNSRRPTKQISGLSCIGANCGAKATELFSGLVHRIELTPVMLDVQDMHWNYLAD